MISFFLEMDPPTATHHHKKIVRIGRGPAAFSKLADMPELIKAKNEYDKALLPFRVRVAMAGPVTLSLEFFFPWRAGDSRKVRAAGAIPRQTKPDCSNLAKTLEDRIVAAGFIENDGQVARLVVGKWFADRPGVQVSIEPWTDPRASVLGCNWCRGSQKTEGVTDK